MSLMIVVVVVVETDGGNATTLENVCGEHQSSQGL